MRLTLTRTISLLDASHAAHSPGRVLRARCAHRCLHRGVERPLDHPAAHGRWGAVMIEFVQQNNPGASVFHDLHPAGSGSGGLHHVALFVDDLPAQIARFNHAGQATALYAEMNNGVAFAMMDTMAVPAH